MVTRDIKANTATQVNANLIGVQVRPAPPVLTSIGADIVDYTAEGTDTDTYKLFVATINGFSVIMQDDAEKSDFGNYACSVFDLWYAPNSEIPEGCPSVGTKYVTEAGDRQPEECIPGTVLYAEDGEGNLTEVGQIEYGLEAASMVKSGTDYFGYALYTEGYDGNDLYEIQQYYTARNYMVNVHISSGGTSFDNVKCLVTATGSTSNTGEEFYPAGSSDNYYVWESRTFEGREFYTLTASPSVCDKLYYNKTQSIPDSNKYYSSINNIEEEQDPIDCTLSYSVDGSTWTEWPENMTDANNVISNIPRYMYLKFSQDVVITEE